MWKSPDIDDLSFGPVPADRLDGYCLNIRPALMADDLKPYIVTPSRPARRWADDVPRIKLPTVATIAGDPRGERFDFAKAATLTPAFETVFLRFPDEKTAKESSLTQHWVDVPKVTE